eukprot:734540-Pyramimonas_sp.AAC.1
MPAVLRRDPEGAFVPREFFENISGEGVVLGPFATRARRQSGIAERAIKTVFDCARSLHRGRDADVEAAARQAVGARNAVERVDGYSSTQWAFG